MIRPSRASAAATAIALAAAPAAAQAPGGVALYGRLDTSIDFADNGAASVVGVTGNSSRWGMRGSEDLGGGLSAFFVLESGFGSDDGDVPSSAATFDRTSIVGLGTGLGQFRLGRDYTPFYTLVLRRFDPFGDVGAGRSSDAMPSPRRESNALLWISPRLAGIEAQAMLVAGEAAGDPGAGDAAGLSVDWQHGPFAAGAGLHRRTASAYDETDRIVVASWEIGAIRLAAQYSDYERSDGSLASSSWGASATIRVAGGEVLVSFIDYRDALDRRGDAAKLALGYFHRLSKRSSLYGVLGSIDNGSASTRSVYGPASTMDVAPGADPRNLQIGIRHNF